MASWSVGRQISEKNVVGCGDAGIESDSFCPLSTVRGCDYSRVSQALNCCYLLPGFSLRPRQVRCHNAATTIQSTVRSAMASCGGLLLLRVLGLCLNSCWCFSMPKTARHTSVPLEQFPNALSEERVGITPSQTGCLGRTKHILLRNLVNLAVFVLFCGWLEFSKSCAFGAGAFGAAVLAALARASGLRHLLGVT